MKTDVHICSHLAHSFLEWKTAQKNFVEKIKTHFIIKKLFFLKKIVRFMM